MAKSLSLIGTALYCNLQLTKDSVGICLSNVLLDNTTTTPMLYPKGQNTYKVNGKEVRGWFAIDFTADQLLNNVTCKTPNKQLISFLDFGTSFYRSLIHSFFCQYHTKRTMQLIIYIRRLA